ncbi:hypothetical protein VTL71DRAFT_12220 [Oculimacula yallundae]|uniref:Uncharacterized protein n=1 Tax=Oculimacula yallundae TaxID=86028 RepID=A0ABR4CSW4_9HELO
MVVVFHPPLRTAVLFAPAPAHTPAPSTSLKDKAKCWLERPNVFRTGKSGMKHEDRSSSCLIHPLQPIAQIATKSENKPQTPCLAVPWKQAEPNLVHLLVQLQYFRSILDYELRFNSAFSSKE